MNELTKLEVPVGIDEQTVTDDEALQAMKRQGFITMDRQHMHDLRTIGLHAHGGGVLRIQGGRALVSQQRIERVMQILHEEIAILHQDQDPNTNHTNRQSRMVAMAQVMGYLASRLTESQEFMIGLEGGKRRTEAQIFEDVPKTKTFAPGSIVKAGGTLVLSKEVHLHQPKAE